MITAWLNAPQRNYTGDGMHWATGGLTVKYSVWTRSWMYLYSVNSLIRSVEIFYIKVNGTSLLRPVELDTFY